MQPTRKAATSPLVSLTHQLFYKPTSPVIESEATAYADHYALWSAVH